MTTDPLARALFAATSLTHPCCTHHRKETTVKTEDHPSPDLVHDRLEDVSTRRRVTGVEAEVVQILGWTGNTFPWVRLADADWHKIDALVAWRVNGATLGLPTPRTPKTESTRVAR